MRTRDRSLSPQPLPEDFLIDVQGRENRADQIVAQGVVFYVDDGRPLAALPLPTLVTRLRTIMPASLFAEERLHLANRADHSVARNRVQGKPLGETLRTREEIVHPAEPGFPGASRRGGDRGYRLDARLAENVENRSHLGGLVEQEKNGITRTSHRFDTRVALRPDVQLRRSRDVPADLGVKLRVDLDVDVALDGALGVFHHSLSDSYPRPRES